MSAPTATTATLITAYRDAATFIAIAAAESDRAAEAAGMDDRRAATATLSNEGLGWVTKLLIAERYCRTVVTNDENGAAATDEERAAARDALAAATAAVDEVLARCA